MAKDDFSDKLSKYGSIYSAYKLHEISKKLENQDLKERETIRKIEKIQSQQLDLKRQQLVEEQKRTEMIETVESEKLSMLEKQQNEDKFLSKLIGEYYNLEDSETPFLQALVLYSNFKDFFNVIGNPENKVKAGEFLKKTKEIIERNKTKNSPMLFDNIRKCMELVNTLDTQRQELLQFFIHGKGYSNVENVFKSFENNLSSFEFPTCLKQVYNYFGDSCGSTDDQIEKASNLKILEEKGILFFIRETLTNHELMEEIANKNVDKLKLRYFRLKLLHFFIATTKELLNIYPNKSELIERFPFAGSTVSSFLEAVGSKESITDLDDFIDKYDYLKFKIVRLLLSFDFSFLNQNEDESYNLQKEYEYFTNMTKVDPFNYLMWLGKAEACAWQSTNEYNRLEETVLCVKKSIELVTSDHKEAVLREAGFLLAFLSLDIVVISKTDSYDKTSNGDPLKEHLNRCLNVLQILSQKTFPIFSDNKIMLANLVYTGMTVAAFVTDDDLLKQTILIEDAAKIMSNDPTSIKYLTMKIADIALAYKKKLIDLDPAYKSALEANQKKCFIATATLGSESHPYIIIFKHFRDNFLMKKATGKLFVKIYYKCGPFFSSIISMSPILRKLSLYLIIKPLLVIVILLKK